MIWNTIFPFILNALTFLIDLFPNADQNVLDNITDSSTAFLTWIASANYMFPIDILLAFLVIIITVETLIFHWHFWKWIIGILTLGHIK